MASQKKVIVRQFVGPVLRGYLPATHVLEQGSVQLLDLAGRVQPVPLDSVKSIAFVKDFNANDDENPEQLGKRTFSARPRGGGLYLKVEFRDNDRVEGITSADLGFLDTLLDDRCISIVPPEHKSNTYRLLIPRQALIAMEIVALTPASGRKQRQQTQNLQKELFERHPA